MGKREPAREFATVVVGATAVQVRIARHRQRVVTAQPEYRDVVVVAEQLGFPVKTAPARPIAAAERMSPH